jgi:hypothetical protein
MTIIAILLKASLLLAAVVLAQALIGKRLSAASRHLSGRWRLPDCWSFRSCTARCRRGRLPGSRLHARRVCPEGRISGHTFSLRT